MKSEIKNKKSDITSIFNFKQFLEKYGIVVGFVLIAIFLSIASPVFLKPTNIINILRQISIIGIVSMGMTLVIIMGCIDLSVGSVLALTGVITALYAKEGLYPVFVPVVIGILVGGIIGLINGFIVAKGKIAPFIVTLGTMTSARGAALIFSGGMPVAGLSKTFNYIGGGDIFRIPIPILIYFAIIALTTLLLKKTRFGRHIYAIGGNENAAMVSGINIDKVKILTYIGIGLLTGLAGVVLASRIKSGQPNVAIGYELDAIAACVIGGVSFSGGIGSTIGAFFGTLIIGVINNGLDLLNVQSYYQQVIKGIIIVTAVLLDRKRVD